MRWVFLEKRGCGSGWAAALLPGIRFGLPSPGELGPRDRLQHLGYRAAVGPLDGQQSAELGISECRQFVPEDQGNIVEAYRSGSHALKNIVAQLQVCCHGWYPS